MPVSLSKSFHEAYEDAEIVELDKNIAYRIIGFEELLEKKKDQAGQKIYWISWN
jgi:hypothetical protein